MLDNMFSYSPPAPRSNPKKNEVDYKKNPTKLFKRLEGKAWDLVIERIQTNDVESKIWVYKTAYDGSITWKRLPLHEACIHKPIPKIIQALIQCYPKAVSKSDLDGRLPLHHACANGASLGVVEQLLFAYPDGIDRQDCWKKTPIQTLMAQYFPDPHCISALKRGKEYYKIRQTEQMALPHIHSSSSRSVGGMENYKISPTRSRNSSPYPASSNNHSSTSRHGSRMESRSPERRSSIVEKQMITGLEGELGKFSAQIAVTTEEKNGLQKKVRQLESEVSRLLGYENANARLQNEVRDLDDELQSTKGSFGREREDFQRDLQLLEDVKRSEERLKRELDDIANDSRPRMLEDKVDELNREVRERDSRYDRDVLNLKLALENAERDAEASNATANKFQDEINRLELAIKRVKYEKDSDNEIMHSLKDRVVSMDNMEREIGSLDRERRDQEERCRRLTNQLQHAEDSNATLIEETAQIARLQGELHNQANYIKDLEDQLHKSDDKFAKLSDTLNAKERIDKEVETSQSEEKHQLKKNVIDLKSDLERANKKNTDLVQDKTEIEKRLLKTEMTLKHIRQDRDEIQRRELAISLEVNKLQRSIDGKIGTYRTKLVEEQAMSKTHIARCNDLEEQVKHLRNNINDNSSTTNETMREMINLQRTVKDHETTIETLKGQRAKIDELLVEAKSSTGILEHTINDKEQQIDVISLQMDRAKSDMSLLQQKNDAEKVRLHQQISELCKELESQKEEKAATEQTQNISRSELNKVECAAANMKLEMQELEEEKAVATKKYEDLEQEKRKLEVAQKELEGRLNALIMNGADKSERNTADRVRREGNHFGRSSEGYNFVGQPIEFYGGYREDSPTSSDLKPDIPANSEEIEKLENENQMLRALLEEDDDKSSTSLEELEERLFTLEETKDAEISILAEERGDLLSEIGSLRDRIQMLEGEVNRLKEEQTTRESNIDKLKQRRDRKKKTIEDRLKAYESLSCAGSVVPMDKIRNRMEKDDTMSTISAMTGISTIGPSAEKRSSRGKRDLEVIFPSSVSITGLSIAEKSSLSIGRLPASSKFTHKESKSNSSTMITLPSTILEERDELFSRHS